MENLTNYGYKGLYNGETAKDISIRKGIDPTKKEILDYMDSTELVANLFRITQTDEVLKNKNIDISIFLFFLERLSYRLRTILFSF